MKLILESILECILKNLINIYRTAENQFLTQLIWDIFQLYKQSVRLCRGNTLSIERRGMSFTVKLQSNPSHKLAGAYLGQAQLKLGFELFSLAYA